MRRRLVSMCFLNKYEFWLLSLKNARVIGCWYVPKSSISQSTNTGREVTVVHLVFKSLRKAHVVFWNQQDTVNVNNRRSLIPSVLFPGLRCYFFGDRTIYIMGAHAPFLGSVDVVGCQSASLEGRQGEVHAASNSVENSHVACRGAWSSGYVFLRCGYVSY